MHFGGKNKDFMKIQTGKMMSGMMKPEYMPQMMDRMMTQIFSEMTAEDKIKFAGNMAPFVYRNDFC